MVRAAGKCVPWSTVVSSDKALAGGSGRSFEITATEGTNMFVIGTVLKTEERSGVTNDGRAWNSQTVHVLEDVKVHQVRLSDDYLRETGGALPSKGDTFAALVEVYSYAGRNGVSASISALRPLTAEDVDALVGSAAAPKG
jgi:hypothetical protein